MIKKIKDKKGSEKDYDVVILALIVMLTTLTCLNNIGDKKNKTKKPKEYYMKTFFWKISKI